MTFLSMPGLITIISILFICNLLDVAKSAWAKLLILITANVSIAVFLYLLNYL